HLDRRLRTGHRGGDDAVLADADRSGFRRNRDVRRDRQTLCVHESAVRIELQLTGARVSDLAVAQLDLQESLSDDRDIEGLTRHLQAAVRENLLGTDQACAVAELHARWRGSAVVVLRAWLALDLVE